MARLEHGGDGARRGLDLVQVVAAPVAHREVLLDELERLLGERRVEVVGGELGELAADDLVDAHAASSNQCSSSVRTRARARCRSTRWLASERARSSPTSWASSPSTSRRGRTA